MRVCEFVCVCPHARTWAHWCVSVCVCHTLSFWVFTCSLRCTCHITSIPPLHIAWVCPCLLPVIRCCPHSPALIFYSIIFSPPVLIPDDVQKLHELGSLVGFAFLTKHEVGELIDVVIFHIVRVHCCFHVSPHTFGCVSVVSCSFACESCTVIYSFM